MNKHLIAKATLVENVLTVVAYVILGIAAVVAVISAVTGLVQVVTGHAGQGFVILLGAVAAVVLGLLYSALPLLGAVVAGYVKARMRAEQPAEVESLV